MQDADIYHKNLIFVRIPYEPNLIIMENNVEVTAVEQKTVNERFDRVIDLDRQLKEKFPVCEVGEMPSCRSGILKVMEWHVIAILIIVMLLLVCGKWFMHPLAQIALTISVSLAWIVSLIVCSIVVFKAYLKEMEVYNLSVERKKKADEVHEARLFKYLDKAMEECWKENRPE